MLLRERGHGRMLPRYAQEQPTSCVAACVRMVPTGFGVMWTESQVRMVFGRPRLGITLTAAHARLIHVGARGAPRGLESR